MKSFQLICVILMGYLMVTGNTAATLTVQSNDAVTTATFPVAVSLNGATAVSAANPSTNIAAPSGVAGAYTARFASGISVNQVWTLTQDSSSPAAIGLTITVTLGSQVSLTVANSGTTTGGSGAAVASAALVLPGSAACGNYFLDCAAGTLIFNMAVPATASLTCIVTITQVAAIVGILQYPTSSVATSPYTAVTSAITTANGGTNAVTTICSNQVSGTNTLLYFISTFGSATGSDQTTNYNKVKAAAALGGLNSNTAYYVANLQTSLAGGSTAPSAQASSLTSVSKSSTKLVAVAGLLTTVVATLFGFAL